MPITVEWDDPEKTVILITISHPVTWEGFNDSMDEMIALAQSASHRVDIISNPGSTPMPSGSPLPHLKRVYARLPEHVGMNVACITNPFARIMSSIVGQFYLGPRFKVASSVEAARETIRNARAEARV